MSCVTCFRCPSWGGPGGGWNHAIIYNCATFWDYLKTDSLWYGVSSIAPGDVVVMNCEGPASHCCIGTGGGVVTCHNHNGKNTAPPCAINGVYRHVTNGTDVDA